MKHTDPVQLLARVASLAEAPERRATTLSPAVTETEETTEVHARVTLEKAAPSALDDVEPTGARSRRRKRSSTRNTIEWVLVLAGALVVALVVKTWLFQAFYIPSGSMLPTLAVGDRVLVNKISYDLGDVDRGDIIVFERPDSWGTGDIDDLIKRVIALPGETVAVRDGQVFIDGEPLAEPYLPDGVTTPGFFPESGCVPQCTIAEDQVFVLGDNRSNSDASNHFGPLPFDTVVGRPRRRRG